LNRNEGLLLAVNEKVDDVFFVDEKGRILGTEERLWDRFPFSETVKGFEEAKSVGKGCFEVEEGGRIFEFEVVKIEPGVFLVLRRDITCKRKIQKVKKEIISTVSHEIKTPLTVVKGNLEYLLNYTGQSSENREIIEESLRKAGEIEKIVKGLGRLFSDEVTQEEVNLKELVELVARDYEKRIKEKGLLLELKLEEVSVRCERVLFEQLVRNLLDNAVRFTSKGKIEVGVRTEGSSVVFFVKDTGVGIPEEIRSIAFEKYVKSPESQGQGIGLSIVKEIVRFHGWEVKLDSEQNGGTEVKVLIPLRVS